LDEGFEPIIRKVCAMCAPSASSELNSATGAQTVMFSATWPEEIRNLADKYLCKDMVKVSVGSDELSANHRVTQIVECVQAHEKDKRLQGLLEKYHKSRKNRILIFVLYKKEAADLQVRLAGKGYNVTAIHGDKSQHDRTSALEEFKAGRVPLLIATDVAARGTLFLLVPSNWR
jgi:ATP-dependent RNA helicase DBP3